MAGNRRQKLRRGNQIVNARKEFFNVFVNGVEVCQYRDARAVRDARRRQRGFHVAAIQMQQARRGDCGGLEFFGLNRQPSVPIPENGPLACCLVDDDATVLVGNAAHHPRIRQVKTLAAQACHLQLAAGVITHFPDIPHL